MTYEEKLAEAKRLYQTANKDQKYLLESLFPELSNLRDERIRNGIIKYLDWIKDKDGSYMPNNIPFDDMISWLKKQGEQKPADMAVHKDYSSIDPHFFKSAWSEEDENMLDSIIYNFGLGLPSTIGQDNWLKSIKGRVQPQPKQEWSERDNEEFQIAIDTLVGACQYDSAHWLESLKQRNYGL